jgi:hypothetical protein
MAYKLPRLLPHEKHARVYGLSYRVPDKHHGHGDSTECAPRADAGMKHQVKYVVTSR